MSGDPTYSVTVTVHADSRRPPLLSIGSILHRRHITVLEAELRRPVGSAQTFSATVVTSARRMTTLAHSLLREIEVLSVDYVELLDLPDTPDACQPIRQLARRNP